MTKKETDGDRKARRAHEDRHDLVRDSTRPDGHGGYTAGIARCDAARMAIARRPKDRTEDDWALIADHPTPPSGVTGLPDWETRGHAGS